MRTVILGIVLAALMLIQQAIAVQPESDFDFNQRLAVEVFDHACTVTKYDCSGLVVPQVRESEQLPDMRIRGMYQGGLILWIDPGLLPMQHQLTVFHEMVHYLQFEGGKMRVEMTSRCVLEREAMVMTNTYAEALGYPSFKRDLDEWRKVYRC